MIKRETSICQQTQALLCKNVLKKWRMKRESLLEWLLSLGLCLLLLLFRMHTTEIQIPGRPPVDLGSLDKFSYPDFRIKYMPVTSITQQIMEKIALAPFMKGVFSTSSEQIFVLLSFFVIKIKILNLSRSLEEYWEEGFVALQTIINSAIIEITTNYSVMDQLMSINGITMKVHPFIGQSLIISNFVILIYIVSFSPMIYFLTINVTRERKKVKEWMTIMGLQDSAFWLSWGLLYAGYIFILANLLAILITSRKFMIHYFMVFSIFLLYGLSLVTFLLSVLLKKPVLTGLTTFLLTLFWGGLGFILLYQQLPPYLEWILSLLSPFAFIFGMIQIMKMDYNMRGFVFPYPSGVADQWLTTFFVMVFDILLYLILAVYFDKILPREYGRQHSPLFFLKSSFWYSYDRADNQIVENETNSTSTYCSDSFESVPPEFHGKEAIRLIKKTSAKSLCLAQSKNCINVISLSHIIKTIFTSILDFQLDIYEGQITAILGHSGAGKSTLINILSGLSAPTEGSVRFYSKNISEMSDIEEIRKIIGVCPQFNVHIDLLTVRENLRLYAIIKGVPPKTVEQEVQRVCLELEMKSIQDTLAVNLSGGQKRKLTFGIAILGDPQVLLLDEPTAGLDPFSRQKVWHLLKEHKADHVILFSTQFMDEADLLADRIVFISRGRLKCAGSSLFLKKKWGIGYHLSLHINESCDVERITSLIKNHIPDAKLTAESEEKLLYTLPLERTDKFPDLYSDLDNCTGQSIMNYGVSMTTLTEVFLNLEGKTAINEAEVTIHSENFVELEQTFSSLLEEKIETVHGMALWRQQIRAVARIRFLKLKHEKKVLWSLILLLLVPLIPIVFEMIMYPPANSQLSQRISPHMYFLSPGQWPHDSLSSLLIVNNTGSDIEDFISSLKPQNIVLEVDDFKNKNGTSDLAYNGAIIVSGKKEDYRFSLACNSKRLNCFPVLMNIVSNGLLRMLNSSKQIHIMDFLLILTTTSISPYLAMSSIIDYRIKAQDQLRISGLYSSTYWCGQALVDIPLNLIILFLIYAIIYIINPIISIIGYAGSSVFFTYVISFIFKKGRKNSGIWSTFFFIVSIGCWFKSPTNMVLLSISSFNSPSFSIKNLNAILFGAYMLISDISSLSILPINRIYLISLFPLIRSIFTLPFLHCIIFLFVLRCLEMKYGKQSMGKDPIFRIFPTNNDAGINPEEPEDEDEDVQAERARTLRALNASNEDEKLVIIASCLRKEYKGKKTRCFAKGKKKVATRNISFCVKKGEILGLLGHNGAGKSTTIRMITGDTRPTAGKMGRLSVYGQGEETINILGYCVQENSLWQNLTVREHLEVYAAVKGMKKKDAMVTISRLKDIFKLQDYMKVPVKELSTGITRKLCFALSILGNPAVMLLDEPSTGMDPEGQQQIWQAIRAIFKDKERGAILTTHYMAEAEAVCDRVAIMVSGELRCIGSIQHLKSKFGKDYLLEIKVKEPEQVRHLHEEILKLFPTAARQERYSSLMVYKLPVEDVHPLSQAFSKLEAGKSDHFLNKFLHSNELSKEQELGNFEEELDTTIKWKLLPQEEP
uniref:ABC transporter domain-containing protein n=1 Tax=Monodelphis domestica TaxID=13616 RepID=A0A5F8G6Z3_MONDO